jgi:predicted dehydrogenase
MEPVRLGIIGCGIAARELHWPALKDMKDRFRITVVCNRTEPKAAWFSELIGGVPYVMDYREVLARDDVDAVSVILPFELNRQVTEDAVAAGKHAMLEKPLASTLDDARALVRLGKETTLTLMVAENFRYRRLYLRTREHLESGSIGGAYAAIWNFATDVASGANLQYLGTKWRLDSGMYPGGFIVDGGVHITAVIHDLFGEIAFVTAMTSGVNPDAGPVDTMTTNFVTKKGVMGTIHQFYSSKGLRANTLTIHGDRGTIVVDNNASTIALYRPDAEPVSESVDAERGYVGEYDNFYRAIRFGEPVVSTLEKAYRDFLVLMRALDAGETGVTVEVETD